MKKAEELYPLAEGECMYGEFGDYDPMLREFGNILIQVDDDDYQGDSRVLYEKDGRFGYLQFGWGSCSGCDALQGCQDYEELQELMNELHDSIKWFDTKEECLIFFEEHDWQGDYSWHEDEQREFVKKVIKYLRLETSKKI